MSGLQGQTPYGLIVFGEGETMFHAWGGFMSKCLWSNGVLTPRLHHNPSVLLEMLVVLNYLVQSKMSLYLNMPSEYDL